MDMSNHPSPILVEPVPIITTTPPTDEAYLILHPEAQPAPVFDPQESARQKLTDFAANYATSPRALQTLQMGINALSRTNNPMPARECSGLRSQVFHYFELALRHDSSLNDAQRQERLAQLKSGLRALQQPFELPERQRER